MYSFLNVHHPFRTICYSFAIGTVFLCETYVMNSHLLWLTLVGWLSSCEAAKVVHDEIRTRNTLALSYLSNVTIPIVAYHTNLSVLDYTMLRLVYETSLNYLSCQLEIIKRLNYNTRNRVRVPTRPYLHFTACVYKKG